MPRGPPRRIVYEHIDAFKRLQRKHSLAMTSPSVIKDFKEDFDTLEHQFMKNESILSRAITLPKVEDVDDGTMPSEPIKYHWICYRENDEKTEAYFVNHTRKPPAPPPDCVFNKKVNRYQYTRRHYQDFKDCIDSGYKVPDNYVTNCEDPPFKGIDAVQVKLVSKLIAESCDVQEESLEIVNEECSKFIQTRYEKYLNEYHETYNTFYLARADFYRKLKLEDLTLEHKALIVSAMQNDQHLYLLEGILRTAYAEKIGSL